MGATVENSRIIVTGGARGIGFETCRRLLSKKAKMIAILDMDASTAPESVKKLNAEFGENRSFFIQSDVSKTDQFELNFKKAVKQLGGLNIVINNAGIVNELDFSLEINVNYKAVVQGTVLAIETMGKHIGGKGGTVINMGSTASFMSYKTLPVYCGTKCAVLGFTRAMALSYEQTGVAVKAVCPGPVETPLLHTSGVKFLSFHSQEKALSIQLPDPQTAESMAAQIVRVIEETPNGTIYVSVTKDSIGIAKIPELKDILVPL